MKYSRKLTFVLIVAGLAIGSQATAFADDNWLQSLFGSNTNNNQQTQTNNNTQNQSLTQGAAEAVNRSQAAMSQDNLVLQQDYQKMEQDRRAGINTMADQQAIQAQRQAMQNDQIAYNQQLSQLRTYQGLPVTNSGYGWPAQTQPIGTPANASLTQGAAEAVNRSQAAMSQDNQALQTDYQKLQQDKRAGINTAADQQAIQAQRQAMVSDKTNYTQQLQQLRTDQGLPVPATTGPGYVGPDGRRWAQKPQGYYTNGAVQPNPQYQYEKKRDDHHRRHDDPNNVNG